MYLNYLIEVQGTTKAQMHCDRHFKKSNFDKSTEKESLEANEKFTLSKNAVAAALIFFSSQDEFGSRTIIKAV